MYISIYVLSISVYNFFSCFFPQSDRQSDRCDSGPGCSTQETVVHCPIRGPAPAFEVPGLFRTGCLPQVRPSPGAGLHGNLGNPMSGGCCGGRPPPHHPFPLFPGAIFPLVHWGSDPTSGGGGVDPPPPSPIMPSQTALGRACFSHCRARGNTKVVYLNFFEEQAETLNFLCRNGGGIFFA